MNSPIQISYTDKALYLITNYEKGNNYVIIVIF